MSFDTAFVTKLCSMHDSICSEKRMCKHGHGRISDCQSGPGNLLLKSIGHIWCLGDVHFGQ